MKHPYLLPILMMLGATSVFSQAPSKPATVDSSAIARSKIDSLSNALEKTIYPEKQQNAWNECTEHKLDFIAKNRKTDKPFRKADSLLHMATKVDKLPPTDPKVQELMQKKFVLQQKWEQKYRLSPEGKHCVDLEARRKHQLDSAIAAHPDYPVWKRMMEPKSSAQ